MNLLQVMEYNYDIAYIVSHGFAARMLTQTNLLGKLVEQGKKVALITPDKNDSNLINYSLKTKIDLFEFDLRGKFESENYMFKRKYYLEDLEKNPALLEKHIHSIRYNKSKHPLRRLRPYYYWIVYKLIRYFPWIRIQFIKKEKKYLQSEEAEKLLNRLRPLKLICTYPVNFNESVLLYQANKTNGIETWTHLLSWDNISCKGRFPETSDKYMVWGNEMEQELKQHYKIENKNIFKVGVPHFDLHERINRDSSIISGSGNSILFAMSSPRFAPYEIEIVEWLAEFIRRKPEISLIVRPHPQSIGAMGDEKIINRLKKIELLDDCSVSYPMTSSSNLRWSMKAEDMIELGKLIKKSELVLNSGSTISIDALVYNKPVLITAFDGIQKLDYWRSARRLIDYEHLRKFIGSKGVVVVSNYEKLEESINRFLNTHNIIDNEKRLDTLNWYCFDIGNSTKNVIKIIS